MEILRVITVYIYIGYRGKEKVLYMDPAQLLAWVNNTKF